MLCLSSIVIYTAVASVKSLVCDLKLSGNSLIRARNKIGPRTDPWGTPDVTGIVSVSHPPVLLSVSDNLDMLVSKT